MLLRRVARPFKVKLYLICLNNKCFDFKPMVYISGIGIFGGDRKKKSVLVVTTVMVVTKKN